MIRTSVIVAVVAILVSLLVHILGLTLTSSTLSERPNAPGDTEDSIALGTAFEELAETPPEPIEPEEAPVPEPPVETSPEPELAEVPTSDARVASPNPQDQVRAPDTGSANGAEAEVPEPEVTQSVDQSDTDAAASDDTDTTPPVDPAELAEIPEASTADPVEPIETPQPEQLAALPPTEVAPVPVIPLDQDTVEPDIAVDTVPEETEPVEESTESERAVTTSLRPRLPSQRPLTDPQPTLPGSRNFDNLKFPEQTIESPLARYQREGVDAFTQADRGNSAGGRGPGNATTTNYAGQVLVHLNRAPVVYVPVRGYAQVFFEINPDGSLAWVDIISSSGSERVERAAKEQVRSAAPFPPPPGGASRKLSFYYQNS